MMHETIWAMGFPRSGTHWLVWLLGDVLNCPTAGPDNDDKRYWCVGGKNRPGPYIIRHTHRKSRDGRRILIVRDPRDVIASQMQYWNQPFGNRFNSLNKQQRQLKDWKTYNRELIPVVNAVVKYEDLQIDCCAALAKTLNTAEILFDESRLPLACERQRFNSKSKMKKTAGRDVPERYFWRGKIGSWKDTLKPREVQMIIDRFGDMMQELGYL